MQIYHTFVNVGGQAADEHLAREALSGLGALAVRRGARWRREGLRRIGHALRAAGLAHHAGVRAHAHAEAAVASVVQ